MTFHTQTSCGTAGGIWDAANNCCIGFNCAGDVIDQIECARINKVWNPVSNCCIGYQGCTAPPEPPPTCAPGQVGTPPNCTTPPPPTCPPGQVGTPPNCTTPPPTYPPHPYPYPHPYPRPHPYYPPPRPYPIGMSLNAQDMIRRINAQVNSQLQRQGVYTSTSGGRAIARAGGASATAGGGQARAVANGIVATPAGIRAAVIASHDRGKHRSISLGSKKDEHARRRKGKLCKHKQKVMAKLAKYGNRPDFAIRLERINRFFRMHGLDDRDCIVNTPVPIPMPTQYPVPVPAPYPHPYPTPPAPAPITLPVWGYPAPPPISIPMLPPIQAPPPYYPPAYPNSPPGQRFDPYQRQCVPAFTPPMTPPVVSNVALGIATQAANDVKSSLLHSDNFQTANLYHVRDYILQNFPGVLNNLVQIDLQN